MGNERREIAASIGKALIHPRLHSRSGMKSKESSTINVLEICVDDYESDLSEESKKKKKNGFIVYFALSLLTLQKSEIMFAK